MLNLPTGIARGHSIHIAGNPLIPLYPGTGLAPVIHHVRILVIIIGPGRIDKPLVFGITLPHGTVVFCFFYFNPFTTHALEIVCHRIRVHVKNKFFPIQLVFGSTFPGHMQAAPKLPHSLSIHRPMNSQEVFPDAVTCINEGTGPYGIRIVFGHTNRPHGLPRSITINPIVR